MKRRKEFALNKLFNVCITLGMLLGCGSIDFFKDHEIAWGFGFAIVALLFTVPTAFFTPYCYAFDSEGVSLCYTILPTERYLWKDIYAIQVEDTSTSSKTILIDFFTPMFLLSKARM